MGVCLITQVSIGGKEQLKIGLPEIAEPWTELLRQLVSKDRPKLMFCFGRTWERISLRNVEKVLLRGLVQNLYFVTKCNGERMMASSRRATSSFIASQPWKW